MTIIVLVLTTTFCWSQVTVTGKVIFKQDKLAAPGVNVIEKGTKNGTTTNFDGAFELTVSDQNSILVFSFIGIRTQEYHLNGQREISVQLKEDCNKDFFDAYHIALYANSGLVHNPIGGQIEISSPYTSIGVIKGSYSYQTNLDENEFQTGLMELSHPISNCEFDMDFRWSYRNVSFNKDFQSIANSGEAQLNLRKISLIAGYSHLKMTKIAENKTKASSGVIIGLGKEVFFRPFFGTISTKIAIYHSNVEYQAEFKSGYRWFQCFVRYNKLDSFDELSLGIGAQISYYKKRR
ncbi:carboxypeptidase-like regulatory domain-containing protein [Flavobacteriaceae bacterium SZ-1-7]|uniref:carboxypeptidase-like regulatory domain-containing protein n=1 Tax=Tamlana sedimenti TaxID=3134126 RepID=UPI0031234FFA